ncbi:MAG: hypothetical protein M1813_000932 [Trichoglossum hirsutum]|nr:MAG: hypothetical protein M1813_000932 [Trichoglossum hirsutum]
MEKTLNSTSLSYTTLYSRHSSLSGDSKAIRTIECPIYQSDHLNKFDILLQSGVITQSQYEEVIGGSTTVRDVIEAIRSLAKTTQKSKKNGFPKLLSKLGADIVERLQRFTSVIDVLVQSRADVGCLVWGGLKLVVQIGHDIKSTQEAIFDIFEKLTFILPRFEATKRDLRASPLLADVLIKFYDYIVDFCMWALEFCQKPFFKKFAGSLFHPVSMSRRTSRLSDRIWFAEAEASKVASVEGLRILREDVAKGFRDISLALREMENVHNPGTAPSNKQTEPTHDSLVDSHLIAGSSHTFASTANAPTNWNYCNLEFGFCSPFYVLREGELESITRALAEQDETLSAGRAAIVAMRGFGSSKSAAEFAYRNRQNYDLVFWLDCQQLESALYGFDLLFEALSFTNPSSEERDSRHGLLKSCLEATSRKWLLVFNNCTKDSARGLRRLVPLYNGHVIFTTCHKRVPELLGLVESRCVRLAKLSDGEGTRLLLSKSSNLTAKVSPEELAYAAHIVQYLDGHPQAISCVATRLRNASCTFEAVYNDLQSPELFATLLTDESLCESVLKTFTWSLQGLSIDALVLLCFIALLKGAAVSLGTLAHLKQISDRPMSVPVVPGAVAIRRMSPLAISTALSELADSHLVEPIRASRSAFFIMHAVAAEMTCSLLRGIGALPAWTALAVEIVNGIFPEPIDDDAHFVETWNRCESYLSQAEACIRYAQGCSYGSLPLYELLLKVGKFMLLQRGDFPVAKSLLQSATTALQANHQESHHLILAGTCYLGMLEHYSNSSTRAIRLLEDSLKMQEERGLRNSPEVLRTSSYLGSEYCQIGRLEEGIQLLSSAVSQCRSALGSSHPTTLLAVSKLTMSTVNSVGGRNIARLVEELMGTLPRAERWPYHPDRVGAMFNTAWILQKLRRCNEAQVLFRMCLELEKDALARNHPFTLWSTQGIASALEELELWDQAKSMRQDIIQREIKEHGLNSRQATQAMIDMGYHIRQRITSGSTLPTSREIQILESLVANEWETTGTHTPIVIPLIEIVSAILADEGRYGEAIERGIETFRLKVTYLGEADAVQRHGEFLESVVRNTLLLSAGAHSPDELAIYGNGPPDITLEEVYKRFGSNLSEIGIDMSSCFGFEDQNPKRMHMVQTAALLGSIEAVKTLLQHGVEFEGLVDANGESAISTALKNGHFEIARLLEDGKAQPSRAPTLVVEEDTKSRCLKVARKPKRRLHLVGHKVRAIFKEWSGMRVDQDA